MNYNSYGYIRLFINELIMGSNKKQGELIAKDESKPGGFEGVYSLWDYKRDS
jgi:hypothetical protein